MIVVNMGDEMFNDGLFYTEQAVLHQDKLFNKWRYCRSAIISYCASAEAEMSKLIATSLKKSLCQDPNSNPEYEKILNYISDPNIQGGPPRQLNGIQSKYDLLRELNGLTDATIDRQYQELTWLRNKIIHYTFKSSNEVYSATILDSANEARETIKRFILELHSIANENPPDWVNYTSSRDIQ
ncbi:hypothetical protein [Brevibacillus sp. HB2.2]|uniref:hypothetical protein n=1 Tax=Brevibacillus sp. HB2.2 TaxID=2738846 RepID=UPI00156A7895|nr:hypothetical protein [Brevibacillus sp. HB2.2]NRS51969.1 hypothetical protein [Brevibacillus sp. HB2.2]